MKIYKFTLGNFAVNNYLVHGDGSSKALLIDAGDEPEVILKKIDALKLELVYLINTHGHGDHIAGNETILHKTGAKLLVPELDNDYLTDPARNLSALFGFELTSPAAYRLLREGEIVELDTLRFQVLHTPGHTPGHISLFCDGHAFVGDVIFQGSIGRTDLPFASGPQLIETIRNKIYTLPENTVLYPGHGPNTTVREEKHTNPFVSG